MTMKNKHLLIRLEYKKSILHEIDSAEISGSISIGRSHNCQWVIPETDSVASGHHAAITLQKGKLCVCDTGSRNGIYIKGQRIQERVLQSGDTISIGDCLLVVEEAKENSGRTGFNAIQFLNGASTGQTVRLENKNYVIGSSPSCDVPVMNQLISQRHAEISVRPDGCWIKDLGSKNGTTVNGNPLKTGIERMLKEADIISFAHVDAKFLDASVNHSQSKLWQNLLIVVITILVVFAGYYAYQSINPSALDLVRKARKVAAKCDFDRADQLIRDSRTCRGAEDCRLRADDLERDVGVWRATLRQWGRAQAALKASNWTEAAYALGAVDASRMDIWSWNDSDAVSSRKQAEQSKKLLDSYVTLKAAAGNDTLTFEELRGRLAQMESVLKPLALGKQPEYLDPLLSEAGKLAEAVRTDIRNNDIIEKALNKLGQRPVDYATVLGELSLIARRGAGTVRSRAEKLSLPLIALQKTAEDLHAAEKDLGGMDFKKVIALNLALPPAEQCLLDRHIATIRREQADMAEFLSSTARQLEFLFEALKKQGVDTRLETPPQIACFFDAAVMQEVFGCDVLRKKLPSRGRTAPAGEYDRVLGIEPFFDFLYSLPLPLDTAVYEDLAFQPEILRFHFTVKSMEGFCMFMSLPKSKNLDNGKLGKYYAFVKSLLQKRDNLVADYMKCPENTREALIARGIAIFLASPKALPENVPENYMKALKKYRAPLIKLDSGFSSADPEQAIRIRDEILRLGIPGDPLVRKMWSKR